jgi:hypothetical protein
MLANRCDNIHLRNYKKLGARKSDTIKNNRYESDWDKQFTEKVKQRIETLTANVNKEV